MSELADLHRQLRTDLTGRLRARGTQSVAELPVPACPAWTVRQTVAHLAGVGADVLAGNLDGVASDAWTSAQVDARTDRTLDELLAEIEANDPQVEAISDAFGPAEAQWLMDCLTHCYDVISALGDHVDPGHPALVTSVQFGTTGYWMVNRGEAVAGFRADDVDLSPSDREPAAVATTTRFEVLRGLTGRRTLDQVRAWSWEGDVDAVLASFTWGPFAPRADALLEPAT